MFRFLFFTSFFQCGLLNSIFNSYGWASALVFHLSVLAIVVSVIMGLLLLMEAICFSFLSPSISIFFFIKALLVFACNFLFINYIFLNNATALFFFFLVFSGALLGLIFSGALLIVPVVIELATAQRISVVASFLYTPVKNILAYFIPYTRWIVKDWKLKLWLCLFFFILGGQLYILIYFFPNGPIGAINVSTTIQAAPWLSSIQFILPTTFSGWYKVLIVLTGLYYGWNLHYWTRQSPECRYYWWTALVVLSTVGIIFLTLVPVTFTSQFVDILAPACRFSVVNELLIWNNQIFNGGLFSVQHVFTARDYENFLEWYRPDVDSGTRKEWLKAFLGQGNNGGVTPFQLFDSFKSTGGSEVKTLGAQNEERPSAEACIGLAIMLFAVAVLYVLVDTYA